MTFLPLLYLSNFTQWLLSVRLNLKWVIFLNIQNIRVNTKQVTINLRKLLYCSGIQLPSPFSLFNFSSISFPYFPIFVDTIRKPGSFDQIKWLPVFVGKTSSTNSFHLIVFYGFLHATVFRLIFIDFKVPFISSWK